MPILMTSVIGWPSAPRTRPSRTSAAKLSILARVSMTSGMTSWPSTSTGLPEKLRSAVCRTARFSVTLIFSPANIASRLASTSAGLGELDERGQNRRVDALLGIVEQKIVEGDAELAKSRRIAGEIRSCRPREHALAHFRQFRQRR